MIRFSAALVAVAIGVLIGGIATSKLLLVYIAIVLSAVALVALAIGVVLKREELFGEGQGLAPAQAGASPVLPARAGESYDHGRSNGQVPPPPLQGAAVGPGAAFAGQRQAGGAWETPAGRDSWASPAAPAAAGWQAKAASGAPATGWDAPSAGEATATGNPARQGGETVPRSWGHSPAGPVAPSAFAPRPADTPAAPGAGPGSAPPNWFNSPDKAAPAADGGWSWLNGDASNADDTRVPDGAGPADKAKTEDAAPPDGYDDWPTRYAWLDDESAETDWDEKDDSSAEGSPEIAPAPAARAPEAGVPEASAPEARVLETSAPEASAPAAVAGPAATAGQETAQQQAEPPETVTGNEAGLVTVLRGVPRFHREDCVLIQFMPEDDRQQLSLAQAREAGCTACTACEPEG